MITKINVKKLFENYYFDFGNYSDMIFTVDDKSVSVEELKQGVEVNKDFYIETRPKFKFQYKNGDDFYFTFKIGITKFAHNKKQYWTYNGYVEIEDKVLEEYKMNVDHFWELYSDYAEEYQEEEVLESRYYDTYSIYVRNGEGRSVCIDLDEPVTEWVKENTDSSDVFLTAPYTVNKITMGGAMIYNGWQYFAWSAGYDTAYRDEKVAAMYSAASPEELDALVEECGIAYIVVDADCRAQEAYSVREDVIGATYEAVYTEGKGGDMLTIYDTAMPIY